MKATEVKPGTALSMNGELFVVTNAVHTKPGKGPAYVQVKMRNVMSGGISEKRLRSSEDVEGATLDRREREYLYTDGSGHVFMDSETYDQITVPDDVVGEYMAFVKPNTTITTLVYENRIVAVELPKAVDLEVKDTPPGIKGATATNQLKEATLETGLKTRVPPFITPGDVVRISTETGEYLSRVN